VAKAAERLQRVVRRIERLRSGQTTEILLTTYWNVFEDGDVARSRPERGYVGMTERATVRLNTAIVAVGRRTGVAVVDLVGPFKGGGTDPTPLLADDGDHPDAQGHQVIARALAAHAWQELGLPA
jgi:lysophospholipase L1-like esterase